MLGMWRGFFNHLSIITENAKTMHAQSNLWACKIGKYPEIHNGAFLSLPVHINGICNLNYFCRTSSSVIQV